MAGRAPADAANLPQFQAGDGISVVSQSQNGREIDLTVNTTDVQGQHKIIVLLHGGLWPPNLEDTWLQIDDVSLIPTDG
jgi:hypothetical protein